MKELSKMIKTVDTAMSAIKFMNILKKAVCISAFMVCGLYLFKLRKAL